MAKDKDGGDASGQSQRPASNRFDSSDQTQHQHHRIKSSKHIVGGGTGGRLHARVPSSKALHKHHAATSTTKLNRRRSLSPDQAEQDGTTAGPPSASTHRRATSDLKLTDDAPTSSHIRKNSSHTSLKRNRSHVDVGKKTKSTTSLLKRSQSNPAVHTLKSGGAGASKVHFNLGDDDGDEFEPDEGGDDEWVDASTSASPLLSRRSSVAAGAHTTSTTTAIDSLAQAPTDNHNAPPPPLSHELGATQLASSQGAHSLSQSFNRNNLMSHKQYLTSRILQRTPSHGAPPMMSSETASVRPGSSRQDSPDSTLGRGDASTLSGTPRMPSQARPGSSGKQELTSRFVGHNSQEPGSEIPIDSFLNAVQHGGISRAAVNGRLDTNGPRRPKSMGNLAQARGQIYNGNNGIHHNTNGAGEAELTDEEEVDTGVLNANSRSRRSSRGYVVPTDMSRTQQKLNLQRASSTLESTHPHPAMGIGLGGVPGVAGPLVGGSSYDSRDPRIKGVLEKTGMEYLVVRRYQNPIARSLARLQQLPGADRNRPIPKPPGTRPSTAHSKRGSELSGGRPREREMTRGEIRDSSVATLIGGQSARRPATPRSAFSSRGLNGVSASSSLDTDGDELNGTGGGGRIHGRLSGSSLINGGDDAATMVLLRNLWDKPVELPASQD